MLALKTKERLSSNHYPAMQAIYRKFEGAVPNDLASSNSGLSMNCAGVVGEESAPPQQCIMHLPHAGSVGSIVSKLPFALVKCCSNDTIGLVHMVQSLDEIIPDATKLRFSRAGFWKRVFLASVNIFVYELLR